MLGRSLHKPHLFAVLTACLYMSDKAIPDERVPGSIWQLLHKQENWTIHLPLFFIDLFQINYVLTPWPYDSLRSLASHTTYAHSLVLFPSTSAVSLSALRYHFVLLSIISVSSPPPFFSCPVFLWLSNLSQYRDLLHTAHWIEKLKSTSRLALIQSAKSSCVSLAVRFNLTYWCSLNWKGFH
jgi:hypothetical protein